MVKANGNEHTRMTELYHAKQEETVYHTKVCTQCQVIRCKADYIVQTDTTLVAHQGLVLWHSLSCRGHGHCLQKGLKVGSKFQVEMMAFQPVGDSWS